MTGKGENDRLAVWEKILASALGGGLSAWNQPIEVVIVLKIITVFREAKVLTLS